MRQIGTLGTIDTLKVGERVFTDLANLIMLTGATASGGNVLIGLSKVAASPTAYQVTSGKTLKVQAIRAIGHASGATFGTVIYGDTAVSATAATSVDPTNRVDSREYGYFPAAVGGMISYASNFDIPATKYVAGYGETVYITAFGYEV